MSIKDIDAKTLKDWIDKKKVVLIDVREQSEYDSESISGAKLIPVSEINNDSLPNIKGKKLVIHCRSGKRSMNACEKLTNQDPELEVYNLEGGILAWIDAGYPIKSSGKKFFLPLDRQVQLTIGIFVIIGSFLSYVISPVFTFFTGFFGAGLCFAGLTGVCTLGRIIAKMPWNQYSKK